MSIFGNEAEKHAEDEALEAIVIAEAKDLGLIDERNKEVDLLQERRNLSTSVKRVKITRDQKIRSLTQRTSIELARTTKDPLFKKWRKLRDQAEAVRKQIEKKFRSKANQKVKQIIRDSKGSSKKSKDVPKGRRTT